MTRAKKNAYYRPEWLEMICFRGTDAPVVVMRVLNQEDMARHIHEFTELVLVTGGTAMHEFGNRPYRISQGDCFIIEPGMNHSYRSCKGLKIANILIRTSFIKEYGPILKEDPAYSVLLGKCKYGIRKEPVALLSQEDLDSCMRIVAEIERERKDMKSGHAIMMTGLLLELIIRIFRSIKKDEAKDDMRSPWLSKVLDYLEVHFAKEIPMNFLQRMAGMSERSFQRHFREMTGLPPLKYILRLRIAHACRLLREGDKSVYEVANLCGFDNCSYFCRMFKSVTGHTPRKYAKPQVI